MKILLKIGYRTLLLPDDKGLSAILGALSRSIIVEDRTYAGEIVITDDDVTFEFKAVASNVKFLRKNSYGDEIPVEVTKIKSLPKPKPLKITNGELGTIL